MSTFDQRGQTVTYQYNYAIGTAAEGVADQKSLLQTLEALRQEGLKAYAGDQIPLEQWSETKVGLELATAEAKKPEPDKPKIAEYLDKAKDALKDMASVAGLYTALVTLVGKIPHLPL